MLSVIVIKSHLVTVFNNNRHNSKQTLILPVHIKSQLSQAKEEYQKNANGFTIMAKLSPGAGFLSIFICPGAVISQKFSAREQGI